MSHRFESSDDGVRDNRDPDFFRDAMRKKEWYEQVFDYVKNNTRTIVMIVVGFFVVISLLYTLHAAGSETRVRNRFSAEVAKSEVTFDTMWKVIKDEFNLAETGKDGFKDVYVPLMEARTAKESQTMLAKFVTEQNPAPDFMRLYDKVAASIEAQRENFKTQQISQIAVKNEDDNWLDSPVSGFVLSTLLRRKHVELKLVTSTKAKDAMNSGRDDEQLIPGKK